MNLSLYITPHGRPLVGTAEPESATAVAESPREAALRAAFAAGVAEGLVALVSWELTTALPASLGFARDFASGYLTQICRTPELESDKEMAAIAAPPREELSSLVMQAPPMTGLEYLSADVLAGWWEQLDGHVRDQVRRHSGGARGYLHEINPLWRTVGRVTFHLAENKRDESHPFAFMATYASRVSAHGKVQHLPLGRALQEYAGAKDRAALLALLTPVQRASEQIGWVKDLVESGGVYRALAWTPREAYAFLKDLPQLESSGIIVRVPNWWRSASPPRVAVSVQLGDRKGSGLGAQALLSFSVSAALEGQDLSEAELAEALASSGGLVRLRGQWVEVDREKLQAALEHWKEVAREVKDGGVTFFEGMRLLAGTALGNDAAAAVPEPVRQWTGITPGKWLEETLAELRDPGGASAAPKNLHAQLRHYQEAGVNWLRFMSRLGLGACLADDMGLGKTIQVLAVLLHLRGQRRAGGGAALPPDLLVVPASLIANWQSEISRFAPDLQTAVAHPSESDLDLQDAAALDAEIAGRDLIITTYGMLARLEPLRRRTWNLVALDEAQAIKNSGTRQTRAVKELRAAARFALTGTPVENRLSDLWSLFDFLNPGLLGGAKEFGRMVKAMESREHNPYAPLRALVRPYILRRLKTDKTVIADLPEKTELKAYCGLSKQQAVLYEQAVRELDQAIGGAEGIQRRGIVLAYLMRLKQICNHPSQWLGDGAWEPGHSGKFARLAELCEELSQRQEKALVFTQFREVTDPLAHELARLFGRSGLVLHGGTAIKQRREMVEAFARDDGPPFFVLSLKAGGTGLNLTSACHVIHFDRWWNPAVENQATDRAFRIGQKRNVMVHKFVCRGTVEEKIDELIESKLGLSRDLLDGGGETMLTELSNEELLRFVSLDVSKATES